MKKLKKLFINIFVIFLGMFHVNAQSGYMIESYDVNMKVNENNTIDIIETITADFNTPKHGIIRTIPLKNELKRLDGTTTKNQTQITNLDVDHEYKVKKENGNYKIQIGSANQTITGKQTYVIRYTYNLGKDPMKEYDELYYNIIGSQWDTSITNITFTITMPKEFDSSKLGFSSGVVGSVNNNVQYKVSENKIIGSYNGTLAPNEALTVRLELPEGYFVGAGLTFQIKDYLIFIVPVLFLIISILLWYKFGKNDPIVETVEFYPPEGKNSLEIGYLYKGKADYKDATSLLIYLANKGYIKILDAKSSFKSENDSNSVKQKIKDLQDKINEEKLNNPGSKKIKYYENMLNVYYEMDKSTKTTIQENKPIKFVIQKVRDYDGGNENERLFMQGLFSAGQTEVTNQTLYNLFYLTMNRILSNINSRENKNKIFDNISFHKIPLMILMVVVIYCVITIPPVTTYGGSDELVFSLIFPLIGFITIFISLFGEKLSIHQKATGSNSKRFFLIWGIGFGFIPWIVIVPSVLLQSNIYLIGYIIGVLCIIGIIICMLHLFKRTSYGNEMLGKIRGFKRFLETAEKEKLEAMVSQNPTYFYDILPYTYVLGVSDKWIKRFEEISLQAPNWYDSSTTFNSSSFGNFMNSTMRSASRAMSSAPARSSISGSSSGHSSSSSSGGGSSGRGSGGGGGSSW